MPEPESVGVRVTVTEALCHLAPPPEAVVTGGVVSVVPAIRLKVVPQ